MSNKDKDALGKLKAFFQRSNRAPSKYLPDASDYHNNHRITHY